MQNRGACFTLEAGHVNEYAPDKRPYHTIIPGMLIKRTATGAAQPHIAFGVMGGYMQPQGQLQVASRIEDHSANPQAALDPNLSMVDSKEAFGFDLDGKGPDQATAFTDPLTGEKGVDNQYFRAMGCFTVGPTVPLVTRPTARPSASTSGAPSRTGTRSSPTRPTRLRAGLLAS